MMKIMGFGPAVAKIKELKPAHLSKELANVDQDHHLGITAGSCQFVVSRPFNVAAHSREWTEWP